jgi:hypothetical protein
MYCSFCVCVGVWLPTHTVRCVGRGFHFASDNLNPCAHTRGECLYSNSVIMFLFEFEYIYPLIILILIDISAIFMKTNKNKRICIVYFVRACVRICVAFVADHLHRPRGAVVSLYILIANQIFLNDV